jgi:hypothetical protein
MTGLLLLTDSWVQFAKRYWESLKTHPDEVRVHNRKYSLAPLEGNPLIRTDVACPSETLNRLPAPGLVPISSR